MKKSSLLLLSVFLSTSVMADTNQPPDLNPKPPKSSSQSNQSPTRLFEVMGEFLYLQAKEEGLEYATNSSSSSTGTVPTQGVIGKVHRIKPEFHPGYRVGGSYFMQEKKGELSVQWMYYRGTRADTTSQPIDGASGLWPDWADMFDAPQATSADARWHLNMNVFDLQLGTWFMQQKVLSLKPFAGFRAAWIDQKLDVSYKDIVFVNALATTPLLQSDNHSRYAGYGICAGVDSTWKIWKGFSLIANADVSLLWSRFRLHQIITLDTGDVQNNISDTLYMTVPVVELMAGVAYEYSWDFVTLGLHAGWEEQLWINQNMLDRYVDSFSHGTTMSSKGNLSLSGWNFRASLSF